MRPSPRDGHGANQGRGHRGLAINIVSPGNDRPVRLERQTVIIPGRDGHDAVEIPWHRTLAKIPASSPHNPPPRLLRHPAITSPHPAPPSAANLPHRPSSTTIVSHP